MKQNIRVKQATGYVGLSKSSLDKLRHFGGGPEYFKLGRAVVYNTDDLDVWMAARRRSETWDGANDNRTIRGTVPMRFAADRSTRATSSTLSITMKARTAAGDGP